MVPEHHPEGKPEASLAERHPAGHKNTRKRWHLIRLQSGEFKAD